ncbi:TPA: hypothetical protein QIE52_003423 [Escherichia coli]|nr:hypothetical protein [Escherichia coli]
MNGRTSLIAVVGAGLAFAALAFGVMRRSEATTDFRQAAVADQHAAENYNGFIQQVAEHAPDGMKKTVATAWANCARISTKWVGRLPVSSGPSQHELDVCEASAVQLATSRGHDAAASSQYAQRLRAASAAVRAAN